MTDPARVFLVVTLICLALVTLATAISLMVARARADHRAPLAAALTFALLALSAGAAAGAVAAAVKSAGLAVLAAVPVAIAALEIGRMAIMRREHEALIGGSAAVAEARAATQAASRSLTASWRLAERLAAAESTDEVETLMIDAVRSALPEAVVSIGPSADGAVGVAVAWPRDEGRELRVVPGQRAGGRDWQATAEPVVRALVAEAGIGLDRLTGVALSAGEERRRSVAAGLAERLRTADDVFGACHLAAQAASDAATAQAVEIADAEGAVLATFRFDDSAEPAPLASVPLGPGGGELRVALGPEPPADARPVLAGIAEALGRALESLEWRRNADERRSRQAALVAAVASAQNGKATSVRGVLEAARNALGADGVILYTAPGGGPPAVVEAVGVAEPAACDGIATQALAAQRVVADESGAYLDAAPVTGMHTGIAAPLPTAGNPAVLSVLFTEHRQLAPVDADDLGAFARLAALALERGEIQTELDRREVLRAGFVEIADALAGPREPSETYAAAAAAARRALRAAAAVVVTQADGLQLAGAAPAPPGLVDENGAGGALLTLVAREGRVVLCADARSDRRVPAAERRRLLDAGQQSALCVPIGPADAPAAVLGVVWDEPHAATDDDLELARHVATAAGAAIERAETLASERRARSRAQELQRIGGLVASNLDAPAVLREIVSQAALLLSAESCVLCLVEGDRLVVRAVQGEAADLLAGEQAPIAGGPTGEVLARRVPVAVADMAADDRFLPDDPLVQARFNAYLGAPILSPDGDLRGVLALYDRRRRTWKPDEIEALEAFANSATVALQNALLYQRVAQEKEKSEAIIASIADGVVVVGPDERVEMWNRAAAAMTGVSARQAMRRSLRELLRAEFGDGEDTAFNALQDAASGGAGVEIRLGRGDREIWLSARAAQLRDPIEDRIGTIYALRDVSEDRELDQLKSDFVATVSHELRTPLTSIYGFAETLLRGDVNFPEEDRKTFLTYIASESERLTRLVDGLLSVTRLEAGGVELDLADIDVADVLREIVVRQTERVRDTHSFELSVPGEPLVVAADRDKLRQIVLNLVDNAIKYSPDGGPVTVSAQRRLDMVEVRVADHGIGISAADQRNLFRKFFRADARMTRGIRGIGLGLYLTRGFVTAMGGRIRVESEPGEGSTFIVELPLRRRSGGGRRAAAAA
jgi:PAS domain S-box-containing protein